MTTKKENAKRLCIYLLIVSVSVLLCVLCRKPMNESDTLNFIIYYILFSFSPAIASLVTRAVTGEGFRDMKLHLHLTGNLRWYLLAFILPLVCFSARLLLPVILCGHADWLGGFTIRNVAADVCSLAALSSVMSIGLLGEELGWRGYMNQKMEPLFGTVGTCIAGGIVWSLWHLPMDMAGYSDGVISLSDTLKICGGRMITLTFFGVFLMWLTKKTDSIFPAVIAHFMFNYSQSTLISRLLQGNIPEDADLGAITDVFEHLPMVIVGVIFTVLLLSGRKKRNTGEYLP